MLDFRKKITIQNTLQIYVPDVINGGDVLIGQVFFTVEDGINVHVQKDIWNKELYERFKDYIEQQIFIFEQEFKGMCQNFQLTVEPNTDNVMLTKMVAELQEENKSLKETNEKLSEAIMNLNAISDELTLGILNLSMNVMSVEEVE